MTISTRSPSRILPIDGPNITNIVCGVHLNCRFDLKHVALLARNVQYRPKMFSACVIKIREPKTTALVFENGKMQVLGARSLEDARLACRKFTRILQKMGYVPRITNFTVQNMVANANSRMVIRLEGIYHDHYKSGLVHFEPELFPGLVFRMVDPKVTALVFAKGKIVLLGAKKEEHIERAMQLLYPVLVMYRHTE